MQLTVTDAVFAVPAYGPQNDVTLKMPAFEWVHVQLHQQKGMISLSPPTICNSAAKSMEVLQGLDGLVNCAALATNVGGKNMIDYDPELWDRVMNINVKGTWLISKACVPHLKQSAAGKIINVASDTALWGAPNLMAYVASKGAIVAMTRSMARELGQFNICVNTLSPGLTLVEATEYVPQERHDLYVNGRAIQRQQLPQDLNGTALYLLSDLSSFVTGQNIPVNGGFVFN
ncbi:short-chain dehydrogenase [Acinetobacter baumannii]|nr:short-chain dehydrogenase [Acinetobacter baumannii]MDR8159840.1 short-chain dehydrogenase [Acinetobacter baumannii]